jgi:EmrB/QacA subfamily drug resistance transporter
MNQKVAVSVVYAGAMFMAVMDLTIVNVALPTIARQFHAVPASVAGAVIGYQVSLAVFIPAASWLGDRFGNRQVLLAAIVIFTLASALCGLAGSLEQLIAFRVLQGIGGGLMTPVGLSMLFAVFPQEERVRASSILIVPTALAPAVGPIIGGLFVTEVSWRWVFYVNVPIGVFALVFGVIYLADQRPTRVGRFDAVGFVTAGLGLGLLMFGVSEGPNRGWSDGRVLVGIIAGGILTTTMVIYELRKEDPLLDLRVYKNRMFRSASLVLTITSIAFFGLLYLLALFLQNALGLDALHAGLTIFPEALGVMAGSQIISRVLYPRLGPRRILVGGLLLLGSLTAGLALVDTGTSLWVIRAVLFVMGFGISAAFLPSQACAFATIEQDRTGVASTLFNAQRQLGGAVGVAMLTAVITALHPLHLVDGHQVADLHAFHVGLLVSASVAGIAALVALTIRDSDAARTMVRRRPSGTTAGTADSAGSGPDTVASEIAPHLGFESI